MMSLTALFTLMMLPAISLLAVSLIVTLIEHKHEHQNTDVSA